MYTTSETDLGSGLGRVVLQVAMTSPVRKAIGLELSETRHEQAMWALEQLQQRHGQSLSNVMLEIQDITNASFEGATHFMLCSTAFSASGMFVPLSTDVIDYTLTDNGSTPSLGLHHGRM